MRQIHTPEAHAITGGSPAVLVGDIDTGIDFTPSGSGARTSTSPTASTARAARRARRSPRRTTTATARTPPARSPRPATASASSASRRTCRIAGDQGRQRRRLLLPGGRRSARSSGRARTTSTSPNNSYFADPYEYNCHNDPVQRAIWKAEQRAILYAEKQGVTVVAAEGNDSDDLAHPTTDVDEPRRHDAGRAGDHERLRVVPAEVSGVDRRHRRRQRATDAAVRRYLKSFYSSFGVGVDERRGAGRRLLLRPHGRGAERARALDLAVVDPVQPQRARAEPRPDAADDRLLLPAGDVDGLTARGRRRGARRQPLRRPEERQERRSWRPAR